MLAAGEIPNARKTWDGGGPRMIPVIDLIAHDLIPDLLALPAEAYPAVSGRGRGQRGRVDAWSIRVHVFVISAARR